MSVVYVKVFYSMYLTLLMPVSEMTYIVLSGTLNSTSPYHTIPYFVNDLSDWLNQFWLNGMYILVHH